jgi:prepilin-type N-terminal cleavage/methylation domain-containing protein
MKKLTQNKSKCFTLIELLVVIAIIAILAAMLLWETICQVIFWKNLKNFDKSATDDPKGLHFQLLFCVLKNLKNFDKSAADNPKRTAFVWLLFAFNKASAGSDAWYMSAWMSQSFSQSFFMIFGDIGLRGLSRSSRLDKKAISKKIIVC